MDFTAFVVVTQQNRMDGLKDGSFYGIVYSSTLHKFSIFPKIGVILVYSANACGWVFEVGVTRGDSNGGYDDSQNFPHSRKSLLPVFKICC